VQIGPRPENKSKCERAFSYCHRSILHLKPEGSCRLHTEVEKRYRSASSAPQTQIKRSLDEAFSLLHPVRISFLNPQATLALRVWPSWNLPSLIKTGRHFPVFLLGPPHLRRSIHPARPTPAFSRPQPPSTPPLLFTSSSGEAERFTPCG
jgi:hypothetical protein